MHPVVESKKTELAILCRRFHVSRLDVFRSATTSRFDPSHSDVDLLVEFERDDTLSALHQYFGLKKAAEALWGRPVDLVIKSAVKNPYVKRSIKETRETVYAT